MKWHLHASLVRPRRIIVIAAAVTCLPASYSQRDSLKGDPVDFGYESDSACCIDVAAVNLLNYLDRQTGNDRLVPDDKSVADQQTDFHKKYDPELASKEASRASLVAGLESTFRERNFEAKVKQFLTADLSYEALLGEWAANELVILLAREVTAGWGHALFLWGLERDKTRPEVGVTDPNIEPNTGPDSVGLATWSPLTIGVDPNGFPDWRIRLAGSDDETFNLRVTAFVSVSDVKYVPDASVSLALFGFAIFIVLASNRIRLRF